MHLPGYQFCGPFSDVKSRLLKGQRGINKLDESCRIHDLQYFVLATPEERAVADLELNEKCVKIMQDTKSTIKEKMDAAIISAAMGIKNKLGMGPKKGNISGVYGPIFKISSSSERYH